MSEYSERLSIRITKEDKKAIKQAADQARLPMSIFVRNAALSLIDSKKSTQPM